MRFDRTGTALIALPAVLSLADIAATLAGQSSSYWAGDLNAAHDANPIVDFALGVTPLLAIPAAVAWFLWIAFLMVTLSPVWRRMAYILLCTAHLVFVWGWIVRWDLRIGIAFGVVAGAVAYAMHRQIANDRKIEDAVLRSSLDSR